MSKSLLLILLPALAAAQSDTNGINAASFYRPVLSNVQAWVTAHPGLAQGLASNTASAEAAAAYAELAPQLAPLAAAGEATYCSWGTRYEDGFAATLPHLGPLTRTVRATLWAASYAASNQLPAFVDHAMEALRLARNTGEEPLLISLLVQVACETKASDLLASQLGQLTDAQVARLASTLEGLPPGGTLIEAARMEKAMGIDLLTRQFLKAMRDADTNVFEVIPETGEQAATGGGTSRSNAPPSWLAENLRLTSVVDNGRYCWIGFETRDGDSFTLSQTRSSHGIELLSADVDRGEAVIARGQETALVKLKSKEIEPFRLRLRLPAGHDEQAPGNQVAALLKVLQNPESVGGAAAGPLDDRADVFLAMLQRTSADYEEWTAALQKMPLEEYRPWQEKFLQRATPLTRIMLPAMDKVMEKERDMLAARARLETALAARRARPPL
jgi:hypothetical protein